MGNTCKRREGRRRGGGSIRHGIGKPKHALFSSPVPFYPLALSSFISLSSFLFSQLILNSETWYSNPIIRQIHE